MTRLEQVLIGFNAVLLALLAITSASSDMRAQVIIDDVYERVHQLDERVDALEAVHGRARPHP